MRCYCERIRKRFSRPNFITISSTHQEAITSRGKICVARNATGAGVDPIGIYSLQEILETNFVGCLQRNARVFKLDVSTAGRDFRKRLRMKWLSVYNRLLQKHSRGSSIDLKVPRVDHGDPVDGGEPQPAIVIFARGQLCAA